MKSYFMSGTAIVLAAIATQSALAQEVPVSAAAAQAQVSAAPSDGTTADGDILVTARRREESLQSIPATVEVETQKSLTRAGVESIADLARLTPGLTYNAGNAGGLGAPVIRGVTNVTTTTFDNNVGVFLDGVYLSAKSNLDIDFFNLSRVEVIKGPQSALYGNNAFAGAINYVLDTPTDHLTGRVKASVGTDDLYEVSGKIAGPLTDTLGFQVVGSYSHFGGTVANSQGSRLGGWDHKVSASAMLDWKPSDALSANLFYYHYDDRQDGSANYIFPNNCGGLNSIPTLTARGITNMRYRCGTLNAPAEVDVDPASYSTRSTDLGIGKLAYDFGTVTARLTGSYAKYNAFALQDQTLDASGGAQPTASRIFTQPFVGPTREWSSELRLESYNNRVFDWATGGYYYDRVGTQIASSGTGPAETARSLDTSTVERTKTKSVFGLGTLKLTPTFDIEGQARWSWEDKSADLINFLTNVVRSPSATYSYGTYRATANWRWADNKTIYASVGSGTKSGGFNNTAVLAEQSYGPEKNTTFEVGSKNSFAGGMVVIDASAYYIKWSAIQISQPSSIFGQANFITNVGNATVKGFDVDLNLHPMSHWDLTVAYSYADPKWNNGTIDFSSTRVCATAAACGLTALGGGIDISGRQIQRTSTDQYVLASTYTVPVGAAEVYLRGDLSYRSAQVSGTPIALQNTGDQTLVNLRLGLTLDKYEVSVFAKNLFDKQYISSAINEPEFFPVTTFSTGFVTNGRTLGLTLDARF
ncbi:TonB-dependent receptor [Sphingomonas bacterium]|uniref:TonB-dependent receptor n=1 Tax=Sphingomonas bacterium TaxID=1895847 RepID=UPI0015767394|nr:TonB-dependent receptor [Sphingomonas bacterium]